MEPTQRPLAVQWRSGHAGRGENGSVDDPGDSSWKVQHRHGSAQDLHDRGAADRIEGRCVVVHHVEERAVVLGSTQTDAVLDPDAVSALGLELARRRSGGGAVLLIPGEHVWVDVVVPSHDPLADDDVERATWWLGRAWARALGLGPVVAAPAGRHSAVGGAALQLRGVSDRAAGRVACFAALGPGEVSVDGRKVLGVSQRRTRFGARFQCIAYSLWDPEPLLAALVATTGAGPGGAQWGAGAGSERRRVGSGGAEWGEPPPGDAIRTALVNRAGAVVPPGWDVVERLLPELP